MCQDGSSVRDGDNSDESSDEKIFILLVEDDDKEFLDSMLLFADHYDKYCNRAKRRKPLVTGLQWVERTLGDRNRCYNMFRMSPTMFHRLHDMFVVIRPQIKYKEYLYGGFRHVPLDARSTTVS